MDEIKLEKSWRGRECFASIL